MKKLFRVLVVVLLCSACVIAARRDPLSAKETDELRELADQPDKRLASFARFAEARLKTVEHMRSDPRFAADRGQQVHTLLEDFTSITDELGDNVEDVLHRKVDARKGLRDVIQAQSDFQLRLRAIKESKDQPAFAEEFRHYDFVLDSAIDAVNTTLDSARKSLDEMEARIAEEKAAQKEAKKKRE